MTVYIAPASEDDARVIAAALEDGIAPWPAYGTKALTNAPWVFVLTTRQADALLARLYPHGTGESAVVTRVDEPEPAHTVYSPLLAADPVPEVLSPVQKVVEVVSEPEPVKAAAKASPAPVKKTVPQAKSRR